jgi:thiamine transport system permease protein
MIEKAGTKPLRRKFSGWWIPPIFFLLFFFFYPLFSIFNLSAVQLFERGLDENLWLNIWHPLWFTIWQALLSTLLTLALGLPTAYIYARYQFPGKRLFKMLITLPFVLPTVVAAAGYNALLGPRGWLNLLLQVLNLPAINLMNTLGIILLAHIFYNTTIVIRVVGSAWAQLDTRLEDAGRALGAAPMRVLCEITLPLLRPAIMSAALLVFIFDFTSFGVILLLGGPRFTTLEVEIYTQAFHYLNLSLAGVLSAVQLLFTLILGLIYSLLNQNSSLSLIPRLKSEGLRKASTVREKIFVAIFLLLIFVLILSPMLSLTVSSVVRLDADRGQRIAAPPGITFEYYAQLFSNQSSSLFYVPPFQAMRNSLIFAFLTVLLAVPFGLMAAYPLNLSRSFSHLMELVLLLPLGTSAVTLGLGYVIAFSRPPLNLANFPYLAPLAHSLVAFPFVVRTLQPAIGAIPPVYRQAASTLGAAPRRVWLEIDLPIAARAIVISAIFAFTISLGEFGATLLVTRPDFPTIPVAIFRYLSQPGAANYGQAQAMATLLMSVCGLCIYLMEELNRE